ncbi:TPA: hypothetical protein DIC20_03385 [Candidatus Dependentiae bacterium]|nr:MAG: ABC transporter related protein [candidate division TM6 bacterium GW2011_GWF2_36_131]KKQ03798.1 MAG: ABC transporter related protein [candidate division TM6 bacterium GW2011_GWE2_36_25]KKQ19944.1 MAG: ABC transporter related protein [candidate division TM6 bacterium GW2011_GWA2_36_9]HBR70566.1 hypothetical protein [Candidatus Dependentiae bacterium]HCU00718.1 hypothetical protein [Candidatus Dependentiae bacterium]
MIPINFDEPWWKLLANQKTRLLLIIIPQLIRRVFGTLTPIFLSKIFETLRFDYLLYFTIIWGVLLIFDYFSDFSFAQLFLSMQSIQYYANQLLIKIDPIFHSTRATGKIIAKIDRAQDSYQQIIEIGIHDLLFMLAGTITALIAVIQANINLGLIATGLVILLLAFGIYSYILNNQAFIAKTIEAEDRVKNVGIENLAQITLIRSTFAGNEANRRLRQVTNKSIFVERAAWCSFYLMNTIMRILYLIILFIVCAIMLKDATQGSITTISAIGLIITFFRGTYDITKVGRRVYWFVTHIDRIKDLFAFLQSFGKQTFPVLGEHRFELPLNKKVSTTIEARKLKFRYNVNAQIFNDHSLLLTVPYTQKNKLYGIIGPSGVGKTTLLSILGGQLKPQEGSVMLNGIDIYAIDDYARRTLITIQNQTATTMRGSVRYNLLFGMPHEKLIYSDKELKEVLKKVGLWKIFNDKEGLDTFIGEGGFTLSGGQRQRFNFASVYLRAKYYESILILMDEPTSSLDEVSETAITNMIGELANKAATFVIAHRLHTIKDASGLLDISLTKETKKMRFYPPDVLKEKSKYYQALLKGEITIID